eukprot:2922254-Pyramimonas_sp.AAC.1
MHSSSSVWSDAPSLSRSSRYWARRQRPSDAAISTALKRWTSRSAHCLARPSARWSNAAQTVLISRRLRRSPDAAPTFRTRR